MFRVVCLPMSYRRRKTVIHQYINNGYYIVLDVNSGSVHSVDPLLYDVISFLSERIPDSEKPFQIAQSLKDETAAALKEKYSQEELREAFEDIQELIDQEELFTADIYKNFVMDFKKRQTVFKHIYGHIAHDCNLACQYCFAEEGEYHGRRALMTFEVGKKALDFLIANSGNRRNLEVDFFGGEPLMNFEMVKKLVLYAPIMVGLGAAEVKVPFNHNTWLHAAGDFQTTKDGAIDYSIVDPQVVAVFQSNCWRYDKDSSPNGGRRDLLVSAETPLIDPASIQVPTLIIGGDKDPYLNLDSMRAAMDKLPSGSKLEIMPGAAHAMMMEKPYYKEFRQKVVEFLEH